MIALSGFMLFTIYLYEEHAKSWIVDGELLPGKSPVPRWRRPLACARSRAGCATCSRCLPFAATSWCVFHLATPRTERITLYGDGERAAINQARKELLDYAVEEYRTGKASLSELAKKTGLDVPTIMDEVAKVTGEDKRIGEGFLSAVKTLSEANDDPEFYSLALKAIG